MSDVAAPPETAASLCCLPGAKGVGLTVMTRLREPMHGPTRTASSEGAAAG